MQIRLGVERLLNYLSNEASLGGDSADAVFEQLAGLQAELDAAIRVLAGLEAGSPAPVGVGRGFRIPPNASTAQLRGTLALPWLRGAPARARKLRAAVTRGRRRKEIDTEIARELRRNGRILLAATKALKRDVKSLRKTFSVFQR